MPTWKVFYPVCFLVSLLSFSTGLASDTRPIFAASLLEDQATSSEDSQSSPPPIFAASLLKESPTPSSNVCAATLHQIKPLDLQKKERRTKRVARAHITAKASIHSIAGTSGITLLVGLSGMGDIIQIAYTLSSQEMMLGMMACNVVLACTAGSLYGFFTPAQKHAAHFQRLATKNYPASRAHAQYLFPHPREEYTLSYILFANHLHNFARLEQTVENSDEQTLEKHNTPVTKTPILRVFPPGMRDMAHDFHDFHLRQDFYPFGESASKIPPSYGRAESLNFLSLQEMEDLGRVLGYHDLDKRLDAQRDQKGSSLSQSVRNVLSLEEQDIIHTPHFHITRDPVVQILSENELVLPEDVYRVPVTYEQSSFNKKTSYQGFRFHLVWDDMGSTPFSYRLATIDEVNAARF